MPGIRAGDWLMADIVVLKRDFGVGLIRKGVPESRLSYSLSQIEALNFADLVANRDRLLNLKPPRISVRISAYAIG